MTQILYNEIKINKTKKNFSAKWTQKKGRNKE